MIELCGDITSLQTIMRGCHLVLGIGRTLIPRYFRSIFEGGVTDLRYELRHPKESFQNTSISLDCDQCTVVTLHGKPMFTKVRGRIVQGGSQWHEHSK